MNRSKEMTYNSRLVVLTFAFFAAMGIAQAQAPSAGGTSRSAPTSERMALSATPLPPRTLRVSRKYPNLEFRVGLGIDQLGVDPNLVAQPADAAFQYMAHTEVTADLPSVGRLASVGEGGCDSGTGLALGRPSDIAAAITGALTMIV